MKKFLSILGVGILVLMGIISIKTFTNQPKAQPKNSIQEPLPSNAIAHMSKAIQLSTETPNDAYEFDTATFLAYRKFMESAYPLIHKNLPRTIIDSFNYIYEWKGTDTSLLPMVLMAHYDVVPVEA